jgi:DNA-directed RNA polymerase subunit H (RpoH/RPB5)
MIDIKRLVNAVLPKATIEDLGWAAPGIHQFAIVVGMKSNPAFTPGATYDPAKDVLDMTKQAEYVPDVRILNLNGAEDQNAIVAKLTIIKNTLPENIVIPQMDPTITAVNQNPASMYAPKDPADQAYDQELEKIQGSPMIQGVPEPAKDGSEEVKEMLSTLVDAVTGLADRINTLEDKAAEKPKAKK